MNEKLFPMLQILSITKWTKVAAKSKLEFCSGERWIFFQDFHSFFYNQVLSQFAKDYSKGEI